jgi:hypothetical protein
MHEHEEEHYLPPEFPTTVVCLAGPRPLSGNLDDMLRQLLDDVIQGLRSPWEASAEYGMPSGKGRPRRFPEFADYVRDRIAYAESCAAENELRRLLFASVSERGTSQARSVMTVRIDRMLNETGQDRAARLRELLADLTEPVRGNA